MFTTFRNINGHIEVFIDGKFLFSADNMEEARKELESMTNDEILFLMEKERE